MLRPILNLTKFLSKSLAAPVNISCQNKVLINPVIRRTLHLTSINHKGNADRRDLRTYRSNMPKSDDGTVGEHSIDIDSIDKSDILFPDENTPNKLFDGILYKELPIFNIKVSPNNTIITLTDFKGKVHIIHSCGIEGFKNAKKGTNIAAQTTAFSMYNKAKTLGVRTARVRVQGIGPGRMSAIKGLQMAGLNIVSVTDNTHVSWNPPRPRKQRRI